ncbi:MAG: carbonic anhydrase family protein [Planctomycetota bacterium]
MPFNNQSPSAVLGRDLVAGVVVFLVALPLCLGIAHASGAPLMSGLISGIIGGLVVGALSGSHISVSGPAAGLAAIVAAQLQVLTFEQFLVAVMIGGALQIAFGYWKAGGLANYFPNSVIKGLLVAIGVLLILKQLPHLVGYDRDDEGEMAFAQADGESTFSALWSAFENLLPGAALVGVVSFTLLLIWDNTRLKNLIVPGALVAVVAGTVLSEILHGTGSALAIESSHLVQLKVLGSEGTGLGDLLRFPAFGDLFTAEKSPLRDVLLAGVTLAIVASLETLLNLEATNKLDPLRRTAPPNRELVAQGIGNLVAGAIGGLPLTSVIVRSSVNVNAGGKTRWSAITHGVLLLLLSVVVLAQVINCIPLSALAAVLVLTGWKLASPKTFVQMWKDGLNQFLPFTVTVLAIVFTDLLIGVLIGLGVSATFVLVRNLHGGFQVYDEDHVGGSVKRIELANQANFINRAHLATVFESFTRNESVVLDARRTDYIDPDVMSLIREFVEEDAPARNIKVRIIGFKERYPLDDVIQHVDYTTRELQEKLTPARVLQVLKDGNERFVSGKRLKRDLVRQVDATADGQHPMAIVLTCIDSRAPVELLFDLGIGDVFVARVAGNVARDKIIGSMEFACKVAGSKLIVVVGHTRCGAVKATCDFVAKGVDPGVATGLTNLPAVTSVISEAVRAEPEDGARDGSNIAFVDRVTARHVHHTIDWIRAHSPTLKTMLDNGEIGIVGGMYDISTGRVEFFSQSAQVPAGA